jgi:3-hydroxybutyryl-CoA dehydrogenase
MNALRERAAEAGWEVRDADFAGIAIGNRRVPLLAGGSLATLGGTTGFHAITPLTLAELTGARDEAVEGFFRSLGLHTEWVADSPGLVLGRIVSQLVNEASFAVGEGVGSPEDVDTGMVLGLNHPRGPFAWLEELGREHVIDVLDALRAEHGDRYRVAPYLRRLTPH